MSSTLPPDVEKETKKGRIFFKRCEDFEEKQTKW